MMASTQRPACAVEVAVDEARRRILVRVCGPADGPAVAAPISGLFRQRPELCAYDMLYDLAAYNGDVSAGDLDPIVEAYERCAPDPALPCRTAFVTPDRYFQSWASAMDEQFVGREHRAFAQPGAALAFLDTPLPVRRRGMS